MDEELILIPNLTHSFAPLYNNPKFADVVITFNDSTFNCHKVILAARSCFFKDLFITKPSAVRREQRKSRKTERKSLTKKDTSTDEIPEVTVSEDLMASSPENSSPITKTLSSSDVSTNSPRRKLKKLKREGKVRSSDILEVAVSSLAEESRDIEEIDLSSETNFSLESLTAVIKYCYTSDRSLLEQFKVAMETYVSPFIFQVVRLYGSLNQFSYDIGKVVNNKYFYDCLIQVQEELVYGHKVVLASRCAYFQSMFSEKWNEEVQKEVIQIENASVAAVLELLHFIYTNNVAIANVEQGIDLLYLSNFYGIAQLQFVVETKLLSFLNVKNVVSIWNAATLYNSYIQKNCQQFFRENVAAIVSGSTFVHLSKQNLEFLLSNIYIPQNRKIRMEESVINWSKENQDTVNIPPKVFA